MDKNEEVTDCIQKGLNGKIKELLDETPELADGKTNQGISFLLFAAYCRNQVAVDLFRQRKFTLNIYEASSIGDLDAIINLNRLQPNLINSLSTDGFTPLGLSCFFGHLKITEYLIQHGADVNAPSNNSFKVAPIHSSCAISHYDLTELLIKNGANVNARQTGGITPLHETAHNGQTKLTKFLLDHGAIVNARTEAGQTPLSMVDEKRFAETAELLKQFGAK